jgi:hypothetical protein
MALTAQQTRRLAEIEEEIGQIENRLAVSHGLGDSHSAQGISTSFNDNPRWRNKLTLLRRMREQYLAIAAGGEIPAPSGINLSNYVPE